MARTRGKSKKTLAQKYPPSPPCACEICQNYCVRPGWWTVEEAARAFQAGFANRMMLEIAPERTFGVLSPAFRGNEGAFALNLFKNRGCTFLQEQRCELHGSDFQPLECRFCHHERTGQGLECHTDIEQDWHTPAGQSLVERWAKQAGLLKQYKDCLLKK